MNQLEQKAAYAGGCREESLDQTASWLEHQLKCVIGAAYCVAVPNGAAGLYLALKAAGVGENDRVLCTTFGPYAVLQAILSLGAVPVFADINPNTFNMDPYCLEYVIGKSLRTKGQMPKAAVALDLFGLPCNYTAMEEICQRFGIPLIEDMTQALGAVHNGKRAGCFGRFAVASLQETKVPGSLEEDGAVLCHRKEDELLLRQLLGEWKRKMLPSPATEGEVLSTEVNSVLLGQQLEQYHKEFERRQSVAHRYQQGLGGRIKLQQVRSSYSSAYSRFVVSLADNDMRGYVMDRLLEEQIPCSIFYPVPLHQRGGGDWERVHMANAERVSQKLLALPMHSYLTNHVIDFICDRLIRAVEGYAKDSAPVPAVSSTAMALENRVREPVEASR